MKDSVVRGRALQLLFDRRNEEALPFGAAEAAISPPAGIDPRDWLQALAQLAQHGLVTWTPLDDETGQNRMGGFAQITERGVDVLERRQQPEIEIRFC
jgi:hypothetical protein